MLLLLPIIQVKTRSHQTPGTPENSATSATDKSNTSINMLFLRNMQYATFDTDKSTTNNIKPRVERKNLIRLQSTRPTKQ